MRNLGVVIGDPQRNQIILVANLEQHSVQQESAVDAFQRKVADLQSCQQRLELKLDLTEAQSIAKDVQSTAGTHISRSIYISTSILRMRCSNGCVCICHRRQTRKTPSFLTSFFGTLFIGYAGLPRITQPCDVDACIRRTSPTVMVTYYFPAWLLARAFVLAVKLSSSDEPQLYLRFPRIVSVNSRIFIFAMRGDVNAMKQLLQKRLGSPFDSDSEKNFHL